MEHDNLKYAIPTKNGNGFIAGKIYLFFHEQNGLYTTVVKGNERFVSFPSNEPSAHLWDGKHWGSAGYFIEV